MGPNKEGLEARCVETEPRRFPFCACVCVIILDSLGAGPDEEEPEGGAEEGEGSSVACFDLEEGLLMASSLAAGLGGAEDANFDESGLLPLFFECEYGRTM